MKYKYLISVAAGALLSTGAFAGAYLDVPVSIDLDERMALGSMVTVRSSKSPALIGCGARYFGNVFVFGFCQAAYDATPDENGGLTDGVTCFTEDPLLIEAIRSISDFSFIQFSWEDDGFGGARCTQIGVSTQSWYIPKKLIE